MVITMNKSNCPMAGETAEEDFCYQCDFYFGSEQGSNQETIICRYPACSHAKAPAKLHAFVAAKAR
ncbi:MAG: hypothetical protein WCP73_01345 [Eubacteriales bacterium]